VARSDPRFIGTTIEGDGDAAHGFQGPARGPDDPNGAILMLCVDGEIAIRRGARCWPQSELEQSAAFRAKQSLQHCDRKGKAAQPTRGEVHLGGVVSPASAEIFGPPWVHRA
jgi:hypothetical protein